MNKSKKSNNNSVKKSYRKRGKTMKKYKRNKENVKVEVVKRFIELLNLVKLYHWKTKSYAKHQTTDELYEKLNEHTDRFVEVLIGKEEKRLKKMNTCIKIIQAENDESFKNKIYEFQHFLKHLDKLFHKKNDSDLLSIRDDLLIDINQFLYLMTFDE